MSVAVKEIKFNHDINSINNNALTIRKNKTQIVNVPEWTDGLSMNPEDSPVAYSMLETNGNTITIQARFQIIDERATRAEIRAIDAVTEPRVPGGCIGWLIKLIYSLIKAIFGNVLGNVKSRWVDFNNGDSGFVSFELLNPRIWSAGVGIYITEWQWQWRFSKKQSWKNMQISKHKIYVIVESPKPAWNQTAGSDQLPWTEVLDYACNWARLSKTRDEAATKITEQVYGLGPSLVEYDCPGGGGSSYVNYQNNFDCTKFLERLKGLYGNGKYVNCTDCATIVSSFANILGCNLWSSRMKTPGSVFKLNPMLAIGSNVWQTACNGWAGWSGVFSYHEVAWKNNCDVNDEVFDACLQVDGDGDPTSAPHTALLATNLKFGDCNSLFYRLRLSPPVQGGCDNCAPYPVSKIRRIIA